MLTKVILDGKFGEIVGQREWHLDCNSPSEALALIEANKKGLKAWIRKNINQYKICQVECESLDGKKENLTNETYQAVRKCKTIRFMPIFSGAGGKNASVIQGIIGVALIIIGAILMAPTGGGSATLSSYGFSLLVAGVGMALGAICTLLMRPSKDDTEDSASSYFFNGAVNTTQQGMPVPLVFGRCRVGSAVISASIDVREA